MSTSRGLDVILSTKDTLDVWSGGKDVSVFHDFILSALTEIPLSRRLVVPYSSEFELATCYDFVI